MLQLILGRSGYGKTHAVQEEIVRRAQAGEENLILLVPEQFSFESERTLLRRLGVQKAQRVQVLSFTRLAETVARECGGLSGKVMDNVTRTLLMSRALEQVADRLVLYRRHAMRADYVQAVLDMMAECKQYAVTPRRLDEASAALPAGTLRQKVQELSCIMEAYEALVADSYLDPADALTRLAQQLPQSSFGQGAVLFVDGFQGFTEQEMRVMALLMRRAARTVIALGTDTLDARDEYALFAPVTRTANRFVQVAREHGVEVASPQYMTENHRAADEALARLEQVCFAAQREVYEEECPSVTLSAAADRYAECRVLTHELRRLMREEGLRCRDVAVVARNLSDYQGILDVAMEKADIPYYMDQRETVATEPLAVLMHGALRCATEGFTAEHMLQVMKTGLLGFSAASIARVEQYLFVWNLSGRTLREEWTANPDGLESPTEKSAKALRYLNLLRRRALSPLLKLADTLHQTVTGQVFARAMYQYLAEAQVARVLRLQAKRLRRAGAHAAADRMEHTWDLMMEILDHFATALGTSRLSAARFDELFSLALASTDRGSIPQGLDTVQIGGAERMRFSSPRVVWVLGANEGVFPAYPATCGLITDRERRTLSEMGVMLSDTGDLQAVEERLHAYTAVAAPSHRLYISYLESADGEVLPPSELVMAVKAVFPHHATLSSVSLPESDGEAFSALAEKFRNFTPERAALYAHFAAHPLYAPRLAAMERAVAHRPMAFKQPAAAADFFGNTMALSATQVNTYHKCRFRYFCEYGLRVRAPRPAAMDSLEFGNLAHFVMETVLPRYVAAQMKGVTRQTVAADTATAVEAYTESVLGGTADKSARFLSQLRRLVRTVEALMWRVVQELRQSRFVPADYELPIGMEEGVPATVLTLADGTTVRVIGKIDRVDVYRAGDTAYIRVVDYKTGTQNFKMHEVMEGLNLQMLLYLFSLWDNAQDRYGGHPTPAGVLYLPAKLPIVEGKEGYSEEKRAEEQLKAMRMNGLLLDDMDVLEAMETGVKGLFIPATLKKDGTCDSRSTVATLAQFGQLKARAEKLLRSMAETLRQGDVAAIPAVQGDRLPCDYCDFAAVCGREEDDPAKEIKTYDRAEVMAQLAKEFAEESEKV